MCTECSLAFFLTPLKAGIVALSFLISAAALVALRQLKTSGTKQRLTLLYVHVFTFVFPFLFYLFFRGCNSYFSGCSHARAIVAMLGLTGLIATLLALALAPFILINRYSRKSVLVGKRHWSVDFVKKHADAIMVSAPQIFFVDDAAPLAFSFSFIRPKIFLSMGLFDILGRKEIEAIILHELAHVKRRATYVKLSAHMARLLSPFSMLADFLGRSGTTEESAADDMAVSVQGTSSHLDSAKRKIMQFYHSVSAADGIVETYLIGM